MSQLVKHLTLLFTLLGIAGNATEVEIGGVRKVHATVTRGASGIECRVSFIPVSCFDSAMNQIINQQKARAYAVQAMGKAQALVGGTLAATNLRPVSAPVIESNRFMVTYRADDITLVKKHEARSDDSAKQAANTKSSASDTAQQVNLLSCVDDTISTLQTMAATFDGLIAQLKDDDGLDEAIATLENSGVDAFEKLANEVTNQSLLLQIEKKDILSRITLCRDEVLKKLAKAYNANQRSVKP